MCLAIRLRGGRAELERVPFDWGRLVLGVVGELAPVATFRDQWLSCQTSGARAIVGDRSQLTLALRQLVLEALRVASPGATLDLIAAVDERGVSVQVVVDLEPHASAGHALFDLRRPTLELVHRVVALHGGSLSSGWRGLGNPPDSGVVVAGGGWPQTRSR